MTKVAVIGLDCATPELVFHRWKDELSNLKALMKGGVYGHLRSIHPPITVPAWTAMMSSRDPGQLGVYGFRNRKDYSYSGYAFATSSCVTHDRVWDILSRAGKRVIVHGVPQTYPPTPVNGCMVSCFLTPSTKNQYTYPVTLKPEVERVAKGYVVDVEDYRTNDTQALLHRIYQKTQKHFAVARHLLETKPWDFFVMVEMGMDRIHHGFWKFMDPMHPKYEAGSPFQDAIRDYYIYCDREIGRLLDLLPDDTTVLVVSDHGAKRMDGGFCFNEWLIQKGYLTLHTYPDRPTPIDKADIDWAHTRAWGDGGYYGRLFLNVQGREPEGIVTPDDYEKVREDLIKDIAAIQGPRGHILGCRAYRPEELYRHVNGFPPDLIVYFGDLHWRSVGMVGGKEIYSAENDTGPDGANHDWDGIFIMHKRGEAKPAPGEERGGLSIYDVAPTLLDLFGVIPSPEMLGSVIPY
jgi:predicted AlkP superfamily phosphohydrolase/phosphomutase